MKWGAFFALLMVVLLGALVVTAVFADEDPQCPPPPSCQCPEGTDLVAKFEWDDEDGYVFEKPEGNEDVVTITGDEDGGTWTSTVAVSALAIKGGQECHVYDYEPAATSGSFSKQDFSTAGSGEGLSCKPDISNIQFCKEGEGTAVGPGSFTVRNARSAEPWPEFILGLGIMAVGTVLVVIILVRKGEF